MDNPRREQEVVAGVGPGEDGVQLGQVGRLEGALEMAVDLLEPIECHLTTAGNPKMSKCQWPMLFTMKSPHSFAIWRDVRN